MKLKAIVIPLLVTLSTSAQHIGRGAAPAGTIRVDLSKERPGRESTRFLSVVGNWSIVEDGGMIGANWGVQWCVVGADRNWAYNPDCVAAAP